MHLGIVNLIQLICTLPAFRTIFDVVFLHFATASAAGILEHEVICDFPQNRPHYMFIRPEITTRVEHSMHTSVDEAPFPETEGHPAKNGQNFVANQLVRMIFEITKVEQRMKRLTGGKETIIIAPTIIAAPAKLCRCIQSVKGFNASTIGSWKIEIINRAVKTNTTGRMASGMRQLITLEEEKTRILIQSQTLLLFLTLFRYLNSASVGLGVRGGSCINGIWVSRLKED